MCLSSLQKRTEFKSNANSYGYKSKSNMRGIQRSRLRLVKLRIRNI